MRADARKQAKNQFSRFTIFVNKGSEGVRETRQPARAPVSWLQATANSGMVNKQNTDTGAPPLDAQFVVKRTLSLSRTTVYVDPVSFFSRTSFVFLRLFSTEVNDFAALQVNSQAENLDVLQDV